MELMVSTEHQFDDDTVSCSRGIQRMGCHMVSRCVFYAKKSKQAQAKQYWKSSAIEDILGNVWDVIAPVNDPPSLKFHIEHHLGVPEV